MLPPLPRVGTASSSSICTTFGGRRTRWSCRAHTVDRCPAAPCIESHWPSRHCTQVLQHKHKVLVVWRMDEAKYGRGKWEILGSNEDGRGVDKSGYNVWRQDKSGMNGFYIKVKKRFSLAPLRYKYLRAGSGFAIFPGLDWFSWRWPETQEKRFSWRIDAALKIISNFPVRFLFP